MSNPWIVQPEEVRINLEWSAPDGEAHPFWLSVKKHLNIGEHRAMMRGVSTINAPLRTDDKGKRAEPDAKFEWTEYSFARCEAFILDWSLANGTGDKMPINRETLGSLHQGLFSLIDDALDEHEVSSKEEKKPKGGRTKRKQT